jgi:methyl-accepting chemotaxis protein
MGVYADDIQHEAWKFTGIVTLISGIIIVAIVALSWLIGSALSRRLRVASQVAGAIAEGRFDNAIVVETRDESGQMLASMRQMQDQLQRFNGEMQTMIRLQQGEDIGHRIPEDFPGDYGTLARGVNTVVFEHLDAIMEALEIMTEYGNGDLHRDMRRLPGQRARLHEALDVKANLSAINGDIAQLAEAPRAATSVRAAMRPLPPCLRRDGAGAQRADEGGRCRPVRRRRRVMGAIAEGDLGQRVEVRYHGAFGRLASAVNRTADQLAGIVRGIQQSADAINTAAGEIASGNTDLSRRTESQAANLEETAASMEELTSTVRQNADSARQADQLAKTAGEVAATAAVVEDVVTTMASIREASAHRRHHRSDRRHRVPDQHPRAERGGGSRTRRRAGRGFAVVASKCARWPAFGRRGQGNQAAHRRRPNASRFHAGGLRRYHDA